MIYFILGLLVGFGVGWFYAGFKELEKIPDDWNSRFGVVFHPNLGDNSHNPFDDQD